MNLKTAFWIILVILFFVVGLFTGMGIQQRIIFIGLSEAMSYGNVDINFNINETKLVQEMNKTIIPQIKPKEVLK